MRGTVALCDTHVFMAEASLDGPPISRGKRHVTIQELDGRSRFLPDIWKRFVTGEKVDLRVNYGFTSKRIFASSMKVQGLNYENIPIIGENERARTVRHVVNLSGALYVPK